MIFEKKLRKARAGFFKKIGVAQAFAIACFAAGTPDAAAENGADAAISENLSARSASSEMNLPDAETSRALIETRERARLIESLRDALARRDAFLAEADALSEAERSRRAHDVAERFELTLGKFPDSVPALFFLADFLCQGGETERAEELLLKAEKIDTNFAPAQFLLAEILAERGDAEAAFPRFSAAVKADPGDAHYHYAFGEFLLNFRARLVGDEKTIASRAEFDAMLQNEFRAACAAAPLEAGFRLRYAESFREVENPDWARALAAWDAVVRGLDGNASPELFARAELRRAEALARLGRFDEAKALIEKNAGVVPAEENLRREIFNFMEEEKKK